MAVACKSPLTGFVGDSLSSGPVAEELSRMPFRRPGYQGEGVGARRSCTLKDDSVKGVGRRGIGLDSRLRSLLQRSTPLPGLSDTQVAAIGPSGEALVSFACISNGGRQAGRTGAGRGDGLEELEGHRPTRQFNPSQPSTPGTGGTEHRDLGTRNGIQVHGQIPGPGNSVQPGQIERCGCASLLQFPRVHLRRRGRTQYRKPSEKTQPGVGWGVPGVGTCLLGQGAQGK